MDDLPEPERQRFHALVSFLRNTGTRYQRFKKLAIFEDQLRAIREFVIKHNAYDYKRALLCGIYFSENIVCVNNRKLSQLLGKSKSSVNMSFSELGYNRTLCHTQEQIKLLEVIPQLKDMVDESKQWTIRGKEEAPKSEKIGLSACCYGCMCGCTCKPEDEVLNCSCSCGECPCGKKFWEM